MNYTKLSEDQIKTMVETLRRLLEGEYGELSEPNKKKMIEELRGAKLELLLDRA